MNPIKLDGGYTIDIVRENDRARFWCHRDSDHALVVSASILTFEHPYDTSLRAEVRDFCQRAIAMFEPQQPEPH